jgi:hypothetical protein
MEKKKWKPWFARINQNMYAYDSPAWDVERCLTPAQTLQNTSSKYSASFVWIMASDGIAKVGLSFGASGPLMSLTVKLSVTLCTIAFNIS